MDRERWQRIEQLYNSALAIAAAERAEFLDRECIGDAELRREIVSLLAAHVQAGSFLASPAVEDAARRFAAQSITEGEDPPAPALIGRSIHQYRILSAIGKGGMGEVWLAEDTRLHRKVALKLLPAEFAGDADRVRRFEQEARAVTALNHPNIVTLFDLGQSGSDYFMATEFVEGRTLRAHLIERGKLPAGEAIAIVAQIADALASAHEAGIVHRDIKPENVMLRRDGYVKVLDFGLAKIGGNFGGEAVAAPSSITEAGVVMGTVSYMSPEQARGLRVDGRTDVFSLGVVLYEMLAGQTPFGGTTASDVIASILRAEPNRIMDVPEELNCIVMKSLAKDRDERYRSIAELAREIKGLSRELDFQTRLTDSRESGREQHAAKAATVEIPPANTAAASGAEPLLRRLAMRKYLLGIAAAAGLAVFTAWYFSNRPSGNFESEILPNLKNSPVAGWKVGPEINRMLLGISPDSNLIAFSLAQNGQTDIYIKQLKGGEPRKVTDDPWLDMSPIWSPDGQQIAYLSKRNEKTEVWLIPSLGGPGRMVTPFDNSLWVLVHWSRDGKRLFFEAQKNLFALDLSSGETTPITHFDQEGADSHNFSFSADERWIAYEANGEGGPQIWAMPLVNGETVKLTGEGEENRYPLWLPDGERVVYSSKRNGIFQICVAWRNRERKPVQLTFGSENVMPWQVSPNGQKIFYVSATTEADIYLNALPTGNERQLGADLQLDLFPKFSPDGQFIVFHRIDGDVNFFHGGLFSIRLDRGGATSRLAIDGFDPRWSPGGDQLAFLRLANGSIELRMVRSDGADDRVLAAGKGMFDSFSTHPYDWAQPNNFSWAPNGRGLAYSSNKSGVSNIWVVSTDGAGEVMRSNNTDASTKLLSPIWSPGGSRLAYLGQPLAEEDRRRVVFTNEAGRDRVLFQSDKLLRMIGWSARGDRFWVATTEQAITTFPADANLLTLSLDRDSPETVARLSAVYFSSLALSPDGARLGYVSRQNGNDEIWLLSLNDGRREKLTRNSDPSAYLSGLTWSPDQKYLCYVKQSNSTSIRVIENFK